MGNLKLLSPIGALISYINYKMNRLRLARRINDGLTIGKNVYINEEVEFDHTYPFLIEIGDNCRISKGVRILAHDATAFRDLGITRLAPVKILEGTFIGERAIILPGVTIGPRALIAAGSVVNRDIPEGKAAAGNPARPYSTYEDILNKYREDASQGIILKKEDIEKGNITSEYILQVFKQSKAQVFIRGVPEKDPYYINTSIEDIRKDAVNAYKKLKL